MKDVFAFIGFMGLCGVLTWGLIYATLAPTKCAPAHHYITKPLVITPPIK